MGDQVMVRLRPERYSRGTATELHARNSGPFRVLTRVDENAYVVDILTRWGSARPSTWQIVYFNPFMSFHVMT